MTLEDILLSYVWNFFGFVLHIGYIFTHIY